MTRDLQHLNTKANSLEQSNSFISAVNYFKAKGHSNFLFVKKILDLLFYSLGYRPREQSQSYLA